MTDSDEPVLFWKQYCQKHHYEEVLVVVLAKIMKCSNPVICWVLQIRPEILSYRLNEGLLSLGEVILKKNSKNASEKIQEGMRYCHELSVKSLPSSIQQFSVIKKRRKWLLFGAMGAVSLAVILLCTFLFFSTRSQSPIILYQDSF